MYHEVRLRPSLHRTGGPGKIKTWHFNLMPSKQLAARKSFRTGVANHKASGSKTERPELNRLLEIIREGDTLVIGKLDRLGRSLNHLIEIVTLLEGQHIGLVSLNDPIDTTTAQGRLVFRIFASLAEFEREVIRERTLAGLASARRRGQLLGRRKGLTKAAEQKARIGESLYKENKYSVEQMARELHISKTTLYKYLPQRGVEIGASL